ncbi:MAG: MBL fold metallo-hydrolase [Parvularculaceae bacterium]|nr:MBL fold metallo-hydrolase [Parvularculaceae bacterium]
MTFKRLTAAAALLAFPAAAQQQDFSKVEIKTTKVAEGVFMLEGSGGNIGLSTGPDGPLVIDDQYAPLSDKILAAVKKQQADKPVAFIVNTHFHQDHAGGNEAMAKLGARIIAHDNVRKRMVEGVKRPGFFDSAATAPGSWPVVTFPDRVTFFWNGDEITVWHPKPAHTDGDAIVEFKKANVVHMGDVFFNGTYPFIDVFSGGDIDGYIAGVETALSRMNDQTKIIPGHGPLATKADLAATLVMLKDVRARIAALVKRGLAEDEAVKADPLKDLNEKWGKGFANGEFVTRMVYKSLAAKAPAKGKKKGN